MYKGFIFKPSCAPPLPHCESLLLWVTASCLCPGGGAGTLHTQCWGPPPGTRTLQSPPSCRCCDPGLSLFYSLCQVFSGTEKHKKIKLKKDINEIIWSTHARCVMSELPRPYSEEAGELGLQQLLQLLLGERGLVPVPRGVAVEHADQGLHARLQLGHGGGTGSLGSARRHPFSQEGLCLFFIETLKKKNYYTCFYLSCF